MCAGAVATHSRGSASSVILLRRKIILVFLGFLVGLVVAEAAVRVAFPFVLTSRLFPDPELGWRRAPNQRVWNTNAPFGEYRVLFTTNSDGFPDAERSTPKPAGVLRVAVIGDSMTEGAQVPFDQRFTALLEADLNAWSRSALPGRPRVEVLNFGVSGYATTQELLLYRARLRQFTPDVFLLMMVPSNDIGDNSLRLRHAVEPDFEAAQPFFVLSESGQLLLAHEEFYPTAVQRFSRGLRGAGVRGFYRWLRDRSRLVELVWRTDFSIRRHIVTSRLSLEPFSTLAQRRSEWHDAWTITGAILREFAGAAAADRARFHVALSVTAIEINPQSRALVLRELPSDVLTAMGPLDWYLPNRMADTLLTRLGLAHTNLLPAMQHASQSGMQTNFVVDGHNTSAGHRIVAEQLLPVLQGYLRQVASHPLQGRTAGATRRFR